MNPLMEFFLENDCDAEDITAAMNLLQANGIVADNCLTPGDVFESDALKAVEWLRMADRITMDSTGKYVRIDA